MVLRHGKDTEYGDSEVMVLLRKDKRRTQLEGLANLKVECATYASRVNVVTRVWAQFSCAAGLMLVRKGGFHDEPEPTLHPVSGTRPTIHPFFGTAMSSTNAGSSESEPRFDATLPPYLVDAVFPDQALCIEQLNTFARDSRFQICKRTSQPKVTYFCCRRGRQESEGRKKKSTSSNRPAVSSYLTYTHCQFSLKLTETDAGQCRVHLINPHHNHAPFPDRFEAPSLNATGISRRRRRRLVSDQTQQTSGSPASRMTLRSSTRSKANRSNGLQSGRSSVSQATLMRTRAQSPTASAISTVTNATAIRGLLSLGTDRPSSAGISRQLPGSTDLVRPQKAVHFLATPPPHNDTTASEEVQAPIAKCSELDPRLDLEPPLSYSSHGPILASTPPPTFTESTAFAEPTGISPPSSTLALLLRELPSPEETITEVMALEDMEAAWEWSTVFRTALQMRRRLQYPRS